MASGVTSAGTLARAFAGDYFKEFADLPLEPVALAFIAIVAAINLRGITESVRVNVAFTIVEVAGLLLIVVIGIVALGQGEADFSRNFEFKEGESVVFAIVGGASLAFYALIGFEDSVNVAEETREPLRGVPAGAVRRPRRGRRDLPAGHAHRLDGRGDRSAHGLVGPAPGGGP